MQYCVMISVVALLLTFTDVANAVAYDYSYILGCVPDRQPPLYAGGIAVNPEFNEGLEGWTAAGNAKIAHSESADGNGYAVVSNTLSPAPSNISLSQTFNVEKDILYTVSAWFQISEGEAQVSVQIVTSTGNAVANFVTAKAGCWTMLKGGFHVNVTEPARLSFEANSMGFDMWVDSISVQPFTPQEWASHQAESVEKVRKAKVKFEVVDELEKPVADAAVSIKQQKPHFPFGCAMNGLIIENQAYRKWFLEKGFRYSVFENELKWLSTEVIQGVENYSVPDAMLEFTKEHGIVVRGHNILWDDPKYLLPWQISLSDDEKREAGLKRVMSVVNKYKGQFIHWDVINENMHYQLFSALTNNGSDVFRLVNQLDPLPIPFLNEFNVVEESSLVGKAVTWRYLQKIEQMRKAGYDGPLGIGLQGHFHLEPNLPYIRASIDMLHATALPIWITEFDVDTNTDPLALLQYMDPLLREFHSHPFVDGIIVWGAVGPNITCFKMCLTDNDYKNLPAGDILDRFMGEFITVADTMGVTDGRGAFEASLFYGEYEATVTLPNGAQPPEPQAFSLVPGGGVTAVRFKTR